MQVAGPGVILSNPDAAITTFRAPDVQADTSLEFSLNVTDVDGSHTNTITVMVQNLHTDTPIARPQVSGMVHEGAQVHP